MLFIIPVLFTLMQGDVPDIKYIGKEVVCVIKKFKQHLKLIKLNICDRILV